MYLHISAILLHYNWRCIGDTHHISNLRYYKMVENVLTLTDIFSMTKTLHLNGQFGASNKTNSIRCASF